MMKKVITILSVALMFTILLSVNAFAARDIVSYPDTTGAIEMKGGTNSFLTAFKGLPYASAYYLSYKYSGTGTSNGANAVNNVSDLYFPVATNSISGSKEMYCATYREYDYSKVTTTATITSTSRYYMGYNAYAPSGDLYDLKLQTPTVAAGITGTYEIGGSWSADQAR